MRQIAQLPRPSATTPRHLHQQWYLSPATTETNSRLIQCNNVWNISPMSIPLDYISMLIFSVFFLSTILCYIHGQTVSVPWLIYKNPEQGNDWIMEITGNKTPFTYPHLISIYCFDTATFFFINGKVLVTMSLNTGLLHW